MEFNEKLQELRKQKGLTQEELAEVLFVSRTAISKWEMGISYPDLFSAIAHICGGGLSWRCEALKNIPIWAFHGDIDDVVPLKNSVEMVDAVNKTGGKARLTILHNVAHNCWEEAYTSSNVVDWLISQSK